MVTSSKPILALSGGVGGAKLALGLADELPMGRLHVLVNTGDDFTHLGLHICPDIDTLLYTLSETSNAAQGWGLAGESWNTMGALEKLGGATWFQLGDKDIATHLWRTARIAQGDSLLQLTAALAQQLGIGSHVHPMCEQAVRTTVHCTEQSMPFQHYFVREQCAPAVSGFSFEGIEAASPNPRVARMLEEDAFAAVIVCPSNPFVSIDPILQIPGQWQLLRDNPAPVVLVSPIVAGIALKGPAAKMMAELGVPVTAKGVAQHYCDRYPGLLDYFVIDASDATLAPEIEELGIKVAITETIMKTRQNKQQLARFVLEMVV
ncbi:MAG: LPPG:FO 2-phospho-L-lactate transferase [Halioglobus sp.]|jgi:LPPG:FO 2-phospho-L-lactate transferase